MKREFKAKTPIPLVTSLLKDKRVKGDATDQGKAVVVSEKSKGQKKPNNNRHSKNKKKTKVGQAMQE